MSRYIKFDDAVKVMACEMYAEAQSQGYDVDGIEDFMPEAKAWLNDAPSIEPMRGEWIDKGWKGDWQFETDGRGNCWREYECSECGFHCVSNKGGKPNFCPNCGAEMSKESE